MDPREKARRDKQRELDADLNNAADLLGSTALGGPSLLFPFPERRGLMVVFGSGYY